MGRFRIAGFVGLTLTLASVALADTLTLKNGTVVEGTYLGGTARTIRMAVGDGVQSFSIESVAGVQFGGSGGSSRPMAGNSSGSSSEDRPTLRRASPSSSASASNSDPDRPVLRRSGSSDPDPERPILMRPDADQSSSSTAATARSSGSGDGSSNPAGLEIPAGTQITVRMIDAVDSQTSHSGDTFHASVDEAVYVNNQVVIQKGASAFAKLVQDDKSGKITGKTVLKLVLSSVMVGDRMVDLNTQDIVRESTSRGARSGGVIGGGAVLGAIIGGIAGGGRGAAIGAGSGAAAGTGAEEISKAQRVRVPSETRLIFTLSSSARI